MLMGKLAEVVLDALGRGHVMSSDPVRQTMEPRVARLIERMGRRINQGWQSRGRMSTMVCNGAAPHR